jgi:hypothetical protein
LAAEAVFEVVLGGGEFAFGGGGAGGEFGVFSIGVDLGGRGHLLELLF